MKRLSIILATMMIWTAASAQTTQLFGDVNKDERINITDVSTLVETVLAKAFDFEYDINGDGLCNISDISYLIECILSGENPVRPVACVDLGLSVRWAAYNIGSSSIDNFGNYYSWGETEPKEEYTKDNALTYNKNMNQLMSMGVITTGGELNPEYDAATVAYGNGWRMPSKEEIQELFTQCTWEDCDDYFPVLGVKVTGPNGNSIFLPQSGEKVDDEFMNEGYYGYFWSSTCDEMSDGFGDFRGLALGFSGQDSKWVNSDWRYVGRPIRPVHE